MTVIICQKCDVSQAKRGARQDKRSSCFSEAPEKVAVSSGRQMGKGISACIVERSGACCNGATLAQYWLALPKINMHYEDRVLLANSVLLWGHSLRSLPDQPNNFVLSYSWNSVLVAFNIGFL